MRPSWWRMLAEVLLWTLVDLVGMLLILLGALMILFDRAIQLRVIPSP